MKSDSLNSNRISIDMLIDIFKDFDKSTLYMTKRGKLYPDSVELAKSAIRFSNELYNLKPGMGYEEKSMVDLAFTAEQLSYKYMDLKTELLKLSKGRPNK